MDNLIDHEAKDAWAAEALARHPSIPSNPSYRGSLSANHTTSKISQDYSLSPSFSTQVTSHSIPNSTNKSDGSGRRTPRSTPSLTKPPDDSPALQKQPVEDDLLARLLSEANDASLSASSNLNWLLSASSNPHPGTAVALDDASQFETDLDQAVASFEPSQMSYIDNLNVVNFVQQEFSFRRAFQSSRSHPGPRSLNTISSLGSTSLVSAASSNSKSGDEHLQESDFRQLEGHWKKAAFVLHCLDTAKSIVLGQQLSDLKTAVKKLYRAIKDVATNAKLWFFINSDLWLQARELANLSTYLQFSWSPDLYNTYGAYLTVLEDIFEAWICIVDPWISIPYDALPPFRKGHPSKYRNKLFSFRNTRGDVQNDEESLRNLVTRACSTFGNLKSSLLTAADATTPYRCPACGEGFSYPDAVAEHVVSKRCHVATEERVQATSARRAHSSILHY